jgi:hypothetical protein
MANRSKVQREIKKRDKLRRNWCRRCPFSAPSGRCLDTTLRSGRCGDWVFYVLPGNKLCRRRWVRPKDPRIPAQLHNRVRFGAASRSYSAALTKQEREACIAAGARRQSRRRLGQSGPLTGQQYLVHKEYATRAVGKVESTRMPAKAPQPQKVTRPSWEIRQGATGAPPGSRGRRPQAGGRHSAASGTKVLQYQRLTRSTRTVHRRGLLVALRLSRTGARSSGALFRGKRLGTGSAHTKVSRNGRRVER